MKGIFLIAFGKRGYGFAAFNMAVSIRAFNPNIKIAILYDSGAVSQLESWQMDFFDIKINIKDEDLFNNGKIDPGRVKTSMYDYLPFDENLYLDVDGIALKDLQPLIDSLSKHDGFYSTYVVDKGGKDDKIEYSIWAKNEHIWEYFGLKEDATLYSLNSSFCYVKKCDKAKEFFDKVKENYLKGYPKDKLIWEWGGTVPDELIFSGTISQFGFNPDAGSKPILFGNFLPKESLTSLQDRYYILSIYGNGKGQTLTKLCFLEWYDRLMQGYCRKLGISHHFKRIFIMADKHVNNAFIQKK